VSSTKGTHTQDVHRSLTRGRELELE
jgi:hypothetical protein